MLPAMPGSTVFLKEVMEHFTPFQSTVGGVLVGLASAMVLYFQGRIAGISGIAGGLLTPAKGDVAWRVAFVLGLLSVGLGAAVAYPALTPAPQGSTLVMAVAGVLVGYGVRLANGCTSGHGVCGIGRFSRRSLVATLTFVGFAMVAVFLHRALGGMHA